MVLRGELIVRHIPREINFTDGGTKAGTWAESQFSKPYLTGEKRCPEIFGYSRTEKVAPLRPYRVNAPEEVDSSLKFFLEPSRHNINYVRNITNSLPSNIAALFLEDKEEIREDELYDEMFEEECLMIEEEGALEEEVEELEEKIQELSLIHI